MPRDATRDDATSDRDLYRRRLNLIADRLEQLVALLRDGSVESADVDEWFGYDEYSLDGATLTAVPNGHNRLEISYELTAECLSQRSSPPAGRRPAN